MITWYDGIGDKEYLPLYIITITGSAMHPLSWSNDTNWHLKANHKHRQESRHQARKHTHEHTQHFPRTQETGQKKNHMMRPFSLSLSLGIKENDRINTRPCLGSPGMKVGGALEGNR